MFQEIEASRVGAPEQAQIRLRPLGAIPPQPQNPRLSPSLATGQPLHLHQNQRPHHDRQRTSAATSSFMRADLWVQLRPSPHAHRPVAAILACVLVVGIGPGARIVALHLRSVSTRSTDVRGRFGEARVAVEATPGAQADENLARTAPLQALLQLHRVVARVEDEHGSSGLPFLGRPTEQRLHLPSGDLVGVPRRVNTRDVHGSRPALANEVELGDELVSPTRHYGLA